MCSPRSRKSKPIAGDTVEAIKAIVRERNATLLAIASSGRGALSRWAFGSVADTLMRDSPAPIADHPSGPRRARSGARCEFKRILVPLDGSDIAEQALPEAARLASATGLPVTLLQVINPSLEFSMVGQGMAPITPDLYNEVEADFTAQANEELDRGAAKLGEVTAGITKTVLQGGTVEAIQHYTEPGDLIVMTSHGRTGFRRFLLGSVAQMIIHDRVAPVVLVPGEGRRYRVLSPRARSPEPGMIDCHTRNAFRGKKGSHRELPLPNVRCVSGFRT